jgi:AbrB family looped-hinge helix DNA binding protein
MGVAEVLAGMRDRLPGTAKFIFQPAERMWAARRQCLVVLFDDVVCGIYNGNMAQEITIDASGRLVIPKDVRQRHRLAAGSRLILVEDGDRIVLVPRQAQTSTIEAGGLLVFTGHLTGDIPDHREVREFRIARKAGLS